MSDVLTRDSAVEIEDEPGVEERAPEIDTSAGGHTGVTGPHIRCPLCAWTPRQNDLWMCVCFHQWNTFDTGGVCPKCLLQWAYTACLRCHLFSRHSDWYGE